MQQFNLFEGTEPKGFNDPGIVAALTDDDLLALFSTIGQAVSARVLKGRQLLTSWDLVVDYLKSAMAFEPREQFRVLFLDKKNKLISDEVMQVGTVDHVPVYPREIGRRAIELGATAIILSHNHPSGDPSPSSADISMTKQIVSVMGVLGISVHDHVIVGRDATISLKQLKMM